MAKRQSWVDSIAGHVRLSVLNGEGNQGFILDRYVFRTSADDDLETGLPSTQVVGVPTDLGHPASQMAEIESPTLCHFTVRISGSSLVMG